MFGRWRKGSGANEANGAKPALPSQQKLGATLVIATRLNIGLTCDHPWGITPLFRILHTSPPHRPAVAACCCLLPAATAAAATVNAAAAFSVVTHVFEYV